MRGLAERVGGYRELGRGGGRGSRREGREGEVGLPEVRREERKVLKGMAKGLSF